MFFQTVVVWNADSGAQVASLVGHEHVVESVAFCSKDGATALAKAFKHAAAVSRRSLSCNVGACVVDVAVAVVGTLCRSSPCHNSLKRHELLARVLRVR